MVHLPGKRDRKVPLLLKQEWVKPMLLLVEKRADCGVESEYYFGVPGRKTHLSPWKVLNDAAINADCKRPDLISTTRLRKYTATVTQVLGLKEGELEWLSNHMGHTADIHRQSYRLHESTIEMAKVSKILLAIDSGNVGRFQGKSLSDIDLDQIELPDEIYAEEDDKDVSGDNANEEYAMDDVGDKTQGGKGQMNPMEGTTRKTKKLRGMKNDAQTSEVVRKVRVKQMIVNKIKRKSKGQEECGQDNRIVAELSPPKRPRRKVKKVVSLEPESDDLDDSFLDKDYENKSSSEPETDSGNESLVQPKPSLVKQKSKKSQPVVKLKWSNEELRAVEEGFQRNILNKRIPRKGDIERVVNKLPVLNKRSTAQIKSKVQHLINRGENIKNTSFRKASEKC
ncbi:uncharacterized protein LOC135503570 [Lineus longissimus]|uniref:uncharacterized protein LOC135503570 n=1 Tax=Lineus longissimus TaxID=88925 RepID=UPI002B4D4483